jgi:hypothetical protein
MIAKQCHTEGRSSSDAFDIAAITSQSSLRQHLQTFGYRRSSVAGPVLDITAYDGTDIDFMDQRDQLGCYSTGNRTRDRKLCVMILTCQASGHRSNHPKAPSKPGMKTARSNEPESPNADIPHDDHRNRRIVTGTKR